MKRYSSNLELAHAWANRLSPDGQGNNMYFKGDTIYSFGDHYEIAKFAESVNDGITVCFVNSNGWSSYTGKHTKHVLNSIPVNIRTLYVPFEKESGYNYIRYGKQYINTSHLEPVIKCMMFQISGHLDDQLRANSSTHHMHRASTKWNDLKDMCRLFNITVPEIPEKWKDAEAKMWALDASAPERAKKKADRIAAKNAVLLEKWLRHEYIGPLYGMPVHFRISKSSAGELNLQTSKGATVRLERAKELLEIVRTGGNIVGEKIDGYTVISNNSKEVTIGCHVIGWGTINEFFNNK